MRTRALLGAASVVAALAFGLLAVGFGQDVNWDQRNYHVYNPYAWLNGRLGVDWLPAGRPGFYNPLLHLPFWVLIETLPPRGVAFVLGAAQGGGAFALVLLIARRIGASVPIALAAAVVGAWGGGSLGLLGTSFFDNLLGLLALGAIAILVGGHEKIEHGELWPALAAGLLVGLATGLKLTMAVYALGLALALVTVPRTWSARARTLAAYGAGGLVGILLAGGFWMATLWRDFANPIFPHLNHVFHSPWAPERSGHDPQFLPQGWLEALTYPIVFALDGTRVGEAPFRDIRLALLWLAALLALIFRGPATAFRPRPSVFVLIAAVAIYGVWQTVFGIYRYAVALEQLAPVAILVAIDRLPLDGRVKHVAAGIAFAAIIAFVEPANWGRAPWAEDQRDWIGLVPPPLERPAETVVVMTGYQPMSYALPSFPKEVRFVRLTSSFTNPGEAHLMNARIEALIARHAGAFRWLVHDHETEASLAALAHYRLVPDRAACVGLPNRLDRTLLFCPLTRAGG